MPDGSIPDGRATASPRDRRAVSLLRARRHDPGAWGPDWQALCDDIGAPLARGCARGLDTLDDLLSRHAWHPPLVLACGAQAVSDDERAIARITFAAAEQRREAALSEASFLVQPGALLSLLDAAQRFGLPLVCAECRMRRPDHPLTFQ